MLRDAGVTSQEAHGQQFTSEYQLLLEVDVTIIFKSVTAQAHCSALSFDMFLDVLTLLAKRVYRGRRLGDVESFICLVEERIARAKRRKWSSVASLLESKEVLDLRQLCVGHSALVPLFNLYASEGVITYNVFVLRLCHHFSGLGVSLVELCGWFLDSLPMEHFDLSLDDFWEFLVRVAMVIPPNNMRMLGIGCRIKHMLCSLARFDGPDPRAVKGLRQVTKKILAKEAHMGASFSSLSAVQKEHCTMPEDRGIFIGPGSGKALLTSVGGSMPTEQNKSHQRQRKTAPRHWSATAPFV